MQTTLNHPKTDATAAAVAALAVAGTSPAAPATAQPADDWEGIFARYVAAAEIRDATYADGWNGSEEEDTAAHDEAAEAFSALLDARAPTVAALAAKARHAIADIWGDSLPGSDQHAGNPAFLSHLKRDSNEAHLAVSLYQDALSLAGERGALVTAPVVDFDAVAAVQEIEAATGSHLSWVYAEGPEPDHVQFTLGERDAARAMLDALPSWEREEVRALLQGWALRDERKARGEEAASARYQAPSTDEALLHTFAGIVAHKAAPEDEPRFLTMRQALRETMRAVAGYAPPPATFSPDEYIRAALSVGLVVQTAPDGPFVLIDTEAKHSDERNDLIALYYSLNADQRAALAGAADRQRGAG